MLLALRRKKRREQARATRPAKLWTVIDHQADRLRLDRLF